MGIFTRKARKILRVFLLFICIVLINLNLLIYPVLAVSTVDSCASQPSCAAVLATESGAKLQLINGGVASTKVIPFTKVAASGATTTGSFSFSSIGTPIIAAVGGLLKVLTIGNDEADQLKQLAKDKYCQGGGDQAFCGTGISTPLFQVPFSRTGYTPVELRVNNADISGNLVANVDFNNASGQFAETIEYRFAPPQGVSTDYSDFSFNPFQETGLIIFGQYNGSDFDTWDNQTKQDAVDQLTDTDIIDRMRRVDLDLPQFDPGDIFEIDGKGLENDQVVDGIVINPSDFENPDVDPEVDPEVDPDARPDDLTDGEIKDDINNTQQLEPDTFTQQNWFAHAKTKLSDKFPFDIFGDLNSGSTSNQCPTYTFLERDFEMCPIKDLIVILKYPAILSFLIWSFQVL